LKAKSTDTGQRIFIPLSQRTPEEQPRERLLRHGPEKLSTTELIAILVRIGTKGRSALQVAEDLLESQSDGVAGLRSLSPLELSRIKGIGPAKAAAISATFELASRAAGRADSSDRHYLETIEDVATHFRRHYGARSPEKFVAFYINRKYRLLGELEVSRGGSNAVVVNPQRVFKNAVLHDAKAIILAHNHPGGSLEPSKQDLQLTDQLQEAGKLFAIPVVEHVLVTESGEHGLLSSKS
jgi:DNA repair protein RadC